MSAFPIKIKTMLGLFISSSMLFMWFWGWQNGDGKIFVIPNIIVESSSCLTTSSTNKDVFVAFVSDKKVAELLLDRLCSNIIVGRQFGKAEVHWSHREQDIIQHIGKGIANLALVKENLMSAFATEKTHGYQVIGAYQDYSAFLISLKEKPLITKQYLWGKKIGLLDYPSSRSGHIIPKQMLKKIGLSSQGVNITYANSHEELRDLLAAGEVDVISSYWKEEDNLRFSKNYIAPIETNVSGSKWYLKMDVQNTDLACAIQNTLLNLTHEMGSEYFNQLIVSQPCSHKNSGSSEQ